MKIIKKNKLINYLSMKIYIITIHCIHNFGSIFQSYGLVKYLRDQGYDANLVDYRPAYYSKGRSVIRRVISIATHPFSYLQQSHKYQSFINKYIPKTKKVYHNLQELYKLGEEDAVFVAGGDQLWNSFHMCGRDDSYKLTFVKNRKKIAYGTSMGRNSFSEDELKIVAEKIADFTSIGLREQSTVTMLQPFTPTNVYHAVDPVILLSKQHYMQFVGNKRLIKEPYMLVYLANKSIILSQLVKKVSLTRNLKIAHVCGVRKKCDYDYFLKSTGPEDLLNLIYYADFVVSASFHATLFSLLFNKQFYALLPEAGTNTRIEDLLSFYSLSNRIIKSVEDIQTIDVNEDLDFSEVNSKMINFVNVSKAELNKVLQ